MRLDMEMANTVAMLIEVTTVYIRRNYSADTRHQLCDILRAVDHCSKIIGEPGYVEEIKFYATRGVCKMFDVDDDMALREM